jgi:predicted ATPase
LLTRLRVQGFKSLHDVELELAPLVVLMGPNAAGKSNLLEALFLLSRLATEQTLAAAFEPPLRGYPLEAFSLPESGLEGLLQQDRAELKLEAEVQPTSSRSLHYRIRVQIQPKTGSLEIVDESLTRGASIVFRHPRRSKEFSRLRTELSAWQTYYLDPRTAMREPQPPRDVTDIGPRGEWIAPFLYRLKQSDTHRKYFEAIRRALRSAIPTVEDLDVDLDPRRGILDIQIRQDGTSYSSRVVSEGTLRVLALCCLAGNPWPGELIAFEEPENGVHPRRIEVIADLLASIAQQRRSQVVVTTHSPTLIAAFLQRAKESPELVKLFRCSQRGRATHVQEFLPTGPLFEDQEVRDSLTGPEDAALVEAMLLRGWLDG